MAEWLCSGLQLRVRRFDSDPRLHFSPDVIPRNKKRLNNQPLCNVFFRFYLQLGDANMAGVVVVTPVRLAKVLPAHWHFLAPAAG